jgi:AcrR family transcriptional regulator
MTDGSRARADASRTRATLIDAGAQLLQLGRPLSMQAVADAAGVARSTLYRHFRSPADLANATQREALVRARVAIQASRLGTRPPLAELRAALSALVEVGAALPLRMGEAGELDAALLAETAVPLIALAGRLADAAGLEPRPPAAWGRVALADFVERCLVAGWTAARDVQGTANRLFALITEPLDQGLLLMDSGGSLLAANADARAALVHSTQLDVGARVSLRDGGLYEDGSAASVDAHPLTVALGSGEAQNGVRGHAEDGDRPRWLSIDVNPLQRLDATDPYGFLAVLTDVGDQTRFERAHLRAPGQLGGAGAPLLDVVRVLDEIPPALLPDQLVAEASRLAGGPCALYMLDIDGSHLLRLAGRDDFPRRLRAPLALGPELAEDGLPSLAAELARELPGVVMAPMWLRGRAVGLLLALRGSEAGLREVARLGAAAIELGSGYTDVFDAARRRKDMTPAAEIQQSLLPPRIARLGSGELAGSVLPSYEVGGDWFDYVENRDGAWIAIADAAGKGPQAAGLGSVGLAALRAARRSDATLDEAVQTIHETMCDVGGPEFFLTAIVARWSSIYSVFSWINCGHPPPLLINLDGEVQELATTPDLPLGVFERARTFRRHQRRLDDGDRLVLYSDGISRRRTDDGFFGTEGIARAAAAAPPHSATATARAIQEAVVSASEDPLPDDAAVIVLAANTTNG